MEFFMRHFRYTSALAFLWLATTVWAADEVPMAEKPSFSASQSMTVTALVEAIDHETRVVTVVKPDGESITFTASDEVRNLAQVNVGDYLVAEYVETVSIEVMANDGMQAEAAAVSAMARTEKGDMPGVAAMDAMVVTSTVEEINLEANTFKLKEADGSINEYMARNPENLKRAAVGDLVVTTVTASVAIVVEEKPAD
jgi:hypothetical protein